MNIQRLVAGSNRVRFLRAQDEKLWYAIEAPCPSADSGFSEIFDFPVPFADTAGATFLDVDSPMYFMRWIRAHQKYLNDARAQADAENAWCEAQAAATLAEQEIE